MGTFKTPDITLAQILAALAFVGGQAVTMGLIDSATEKFVLGIGITVVTAAWAVADAIIRHGRATGNASKG